jgi:GrpB-like predicted nucleotidyltransferase (UPF0157 family)
MIDTDIVHFYKSSEIFDKAAEIFEREKAEIDALCPGLDIQHVGSSAIPGMFTKFDIDIQIRVTPEQFSKAVEAVKTKYTEKHPVLWNEEFALFKSHPTSDVEIDCMITIIGSKNDIYHSLRDFMINNPEVIEKYNELKVKYEGRTMKDYRDAKKIFLGSYENCNFPI